jgi:hypothetical protein
MRALVRLTGPLSRIYSGPLASSPLRGFHLTLKGARAEVRGSYAPASRGVPAQSRRAPPRYPGRVHVSVAGETAGCTHEARLALARPRIHVPARRASLARVRGADTLYSSRSLVTQPTHQQAPSRSKNLPVEPCLLPDVATRLSQCAPCAAGHADHSQVFHPDHVEPARQVCTRLLNPVLALCHVGLRWVPAAKFAMAWAKSRNPCCWTIWLPARSQS